MKVKYLGFGGVEIDGKCYENDVVVSRGRVEKRKKKLSKHLRKSTGTHLYPLPRIYHGTAKHLSSEQVNRARSRCWTR